MDSIDSREGCDYFYQIFKQLKNNLVENREIFNKLIVLKDKGEAELRKLNEILSAELSKLSTDPSYNLSGSSVVANAFFIDKEYNVKLDASSDKSSQFTL